MNTSMNLFPGVTVEPVKMTGTPVICVLGVLANERGLAIKQELLSWITNKYDCIAVNQEPPGRLFEYPALWIAQQTALSMNKPVLYLHTKGAANPNNVYNQVRVRKLWRFEYDVHYTDYMNFLKLGPRVVACPFTGTKTHTTWLNGFVATPEAWRVADNITPPKTYSDGNRYPYEHCFRDAPVTGIGRILNDIEGYPEPGGMKMVRFINENV